MSQDYTDDCFASNHAVQTDQQNVENNFAALKSAFSGAAAPPNPIAGMWWFDTDAHLLKERNEANNAWLHIWDLANNKPVIANLSNEITVVMMAAAIKDPAAGIYGLRRLGTTSQKACAGDDARLSDERTPPNASVSRTKLKTSMGSINVTATGANAETKTNLTLPGGEYGFWPQTKATRDNIHTMASEARVLNADSLAAPFSTSYRSNMWLRVKVGLNSQTCYTYAQQRYITASGEIHWVFILRTKFDKTFEGKDIDGNPMTHFRPKGTVVSMWQAPDHPCFGNGGKPLLMPHPFGNYDEAKHEIVVINPSLEEIEQMELETIVDDETKPDKDLLEIIAENYEIDENSRSRWPTKLVTVGLPKHIKDKKTGKKILADYRFMKEGTIIEPIKKVIPKPDYIKVKRLKRK